MRSQIDYIESVWYNYPMRDFDANKERSERKLSINSFLKEYNENLPGEFPLASRPVLRKFSKAHPGLFKNGDVWTLDQHRRKFMDWVRHYESSLLRISNKA